MTLIFRLLLALTATLWIAGCGSGDSEGGDGHEGHDHSHEDEEDGHNEGESHADAHGQTEPLGSFAIGDMNVQASQAGELEPGGECVLFITLPDSEDGQSTVRAWLGTDDRTLSGGVAQGHYIASEGFYDIHVTAPDPLPENTMWRVEVERSDGTKLLGAVAPHRH